MPYTRAQRTEPAAQSAGCISNGFVLIVFADVKVFMSSKKVDASLQSSKSKEAFSVDRQHIRDQSESLEDIIFLCLVPSLFGDMRDGDRAGACDVAGVIVSVGEPV